MSEVIIIAHNIRSTHNVGAIFRTAEGFGITKIVLSGYTPYPRLTNPNSIKIPGKDAPKDTRLPHISEKLTSQIHKTALGAEEIVPFEYIEMPDLEGYIADGYRLVALEQDTSSIALQNYQAPEKIALLIGEEVHGIEPELLAQCQDILEIPMVGKKESFNVSVATGIALYAITVAQAI